MRSDAASSVVRVWRKFSKTGEVTEVVREAPEGIPAYLMGPVVEWLMKAVLTRHDDGIVGRSTRATSRRSWREAVACGRLCRTRTARPLSSPDVRPDLFGRRSWSFRPAREGTSTSSGRGTG